MVYMLAGCVTVTEGDESYTLQPGEAATFRAGDANGHCLENRSERPASYLVIGTRSTGDTITYPDHDRVLHTKRESGAWQVSERRYTTLAGAPADAPT